MVMVALLGPYQRKKKFFRSFTSTLFEVFNITDRKPGIRMTIRIHVLWIFLPVAIHKARLSYF